MKNLFVLIASFFGAFIVTLLGGVVFSLYKMDALKLVSFILSAVFFAAFITVLIIGYVASAKAKKRSTEKSDGEK